MKKVLLAGTAALVLAGSTAVYAQHRPWFHDHMRMSAEDYVKRGVEYKKDLKRIG